MLEESLFGDLPAQHPASISEGQCDPNICRSLPKPAADVLLRAIELQRDDLNVVTGGCGIGGAHMDCFRRRGLTMAETPKSAIFAAQHAGDPATQTTRLDDPGRPQHGSQLCGPSFRWCPHTLLQMKQTTCGLSQCLDLSSRLACIPATCQGKPFDNLRD